MKKEFLQEEILNKLKSLVTEVGEFNYNKNFNHKAYCEDLTKLSPENFKVLYNIDNIDNNNDQQDNDKYGIFIQLTMMNNLIIYE